MGEMDRFAFLVCLPSCLLKGKGKGYWPPLSDTPILCMCVLNSRAVAPALLLLLLHSSPCCLQYKRAHGAGMKL